MDDRVGQVESGATATLLRGLSDGLLAALEKEEEGETGVEGSTELSASAFIKNRLAAKSNDPRQQQETLSSASGLITNLSPESFGIDPKNTMTEEELEDIAYTEVCVHFFFFRETTVGDHCSYHKMCLPKIAAFRIHPSDLFFLQTILRNVVVVVVAMTFFSVSVFFLLRLLYDHHSGNEKCVGEVE